MSEIVVLHIFEHFIQREEQQKKEEKSGFCQRLIVRPFKAQSDINYGSNKKNFNNAENDTNKRQHKTRHKRQK